MKKITVTVLSAVLALSLAFGAFSALMGDTDSDGRITASDARTVLRYSAKLASLTRDQLAVSDLNSDSKVTAADARIILRISARLDNIENYTKNSSNENQTERNTEPVPSGEKLTANEIYYSAKKYTLTIKASGKDGKTTATGTGFYINKNGWIATNYHVIKDAYSVSASDGDKNTYNITRIIAYSQLKDIAIISAEQTETPYAVFSSSYGTGDTVYALGSPLGLELTFTSGMISQADRSFYELNDGISYIQTTAPINVGNSGSPLIDEYGNVIGICSMTYQSAQNMNFAIPVSELSKLDSSNPITVRTFYARVHSDSESDDFMGILLPGTDSITMSEGGTYALYVIGVANDDYTIEYSVSNGDFTVIRGGTYSNVTMLYITAGKQSSSAELSLWFDRSPSSKKTVSLFSSPATDIPVYSGIKGGVPDFGALCSVSPFKASDSDADGKNSYAFYYDLNSIESSGLTAEKAVSGYAQLLISSGFSVIQSDDENFRYAFENLLTKTNVYIVKEPVGSQTYISVLVSY